jgi:molybdopterin converting factor small subunit
MSIKIDIPSYLQPFTDGREAIEVNGSTVSECLNHLVRQFPDVEKVLLAENGELLEDIGIYVNGEDAYPDELAKPVRDGDELYVLYMIAGG